jgi:hypothetical protein
MSLMGHSRHSRHPGVSGSPKSRRPRFGPHVQFGRVQTLVPESGPLCLAGSRAGRVVVVGSAPPSGSDSAAVMSAALMRLSHGIAQSELPQINVAPHRRPRIEETAHAP